MRLYTGESMHRKTSKRRKRAQLTFVYFIMTLAVISSVAVLVLVILGYRFNRFDGKVEQGGLVQFDSRPAGATVTLDSVQLANKTASKITATAGSHTVKMTKDGYTQWQKDVVVKPGTVLWLNYARMLPTKLISTEVATAPTITSAVVSPDKRWMAFIGPDNDPTVSIVDLNAQTPVIRQVTLFASDYSAVPDGQTQKFAVGSWASDNRSVMVTHTYGDKTEYLSVDSRGIEPVRNISTLLGVDALAAMYSLVDTNLMYILTSQHELREANLDARTLSGPLLYNIADVVQFDRSTLVYETLPDSKQTRQVGYLTTGASKPKVVRTEADTTKPFKMRFGRYYNADYVLIHQGAQTEILIGDLPASDSASEPNLKRYALVADETGADYLGFSPGENRFAYVQHGATVLTYDLELRSAARVTLTTTPRREIDWLDNYHIVTTVGGVAALQDFDGTNYQQFADTNVADILTTISANGSYMYHVAQRPSGAAIVRTKLLVD